MQIMCISKKWTNTSTFINFSQIMKNEISEIHFELTVSAPAASVQGFIQAELNAILLVLTLDNS